MQIQISWLLKKPTDLDLHCLLRQGMSCSAREVMFSGNSEEDNSLIFSCLDSCFKYWRQCRINSYLIWQKISRKYRLVYIVPDKALSFWNKTQKKPILIITVNVLKFQTLNSILFWPKFCILCSSFLKYLVGKQCRPRSDGSLRSSLIWVCTVCMCHLSDTLVYEILGNLP